MNSTSTEPYIVFPPTEPPRGRASSGTKWAVLLFFLFICVTPTLGLYWLGQHYRRLDMQGSDMEPTILRGDRILVDRQYFKTHSPMQGEVVLFKKGKILLIKRVSALPGDTIEGKGGVIYVNGKIVNEPYVQHIGMKVNADFLQNFGPITIKAGECFVMGDNRDNSLDSRAPKYGPIPITTMEGRPLYILVSKKPGRAWERIQ